MKRILFCLLLVAGVAQAQTYNNEWIDFTKTYYKFKVGATGLKRITQATLAAAGLGSSTAESFQLWRNGVQVPIYTSVATGTLSASDYIEFWGVMNDGAPDRELYRQPEYLLNDKWSLQTDTATYFLTVNPGGQNLRLVNTANNVAGNTLPAEPYFMHKVGNYFKNQINGGYAVNVGEYMYSSSYDRGEGWSSANIGTNGTNSFTFSNLFPYTTGPDAKFSIAVSGNATNPRRYRANLNGDSLIGRDINFLNELRDSTTFPVSKIASGSAAIVVSNITTYSNDRMVIHKYELTYPRQFNFGGASNFEFTLPASATAKYLQITGFSYGTVAPVLYDLTNGKRYIADISTAGQVKVVIETSATERQLVLVREETSNITSISALVSRTFTDFGQIGNQGNYLIISNPILFNGPNGTNPVEDYRAYRASTTGGGYNAKIYLIDDLVDQFAFGIKKSPAAVRNFLMFARHRFTSAPKHVFLIGKGVTYVAYRNSESTPGIENLNLVPTFGNPASDVMLSADPSTSDPKIPIGRISVINGQEINDYLNKVKEFELAQQTPSPLIADKAWMKNVVHAVGTSEPGLLATIDGYVNNYKRIISDTLFGGKVTTFTKSSANTIEQVNSGELDRLFAEGITLLTYFGHSSSNTLEFNLNNPSQYNNAGKYPMFIALGCNAGGYFGANRAETLSEKFVLAPQRGSIGFLASSHFGITDYLDIYCHQIYNELGYKSYGKPFGEILKSAINDVFSVSTQEDFYARATIEESCLNGDPAITLNPHPKPDYAIEESMVSVNPGFVSVADAKFNLKAKSINIGKAISRNIAWKVKRTFPDGTIQTVYRDTIPGIRFSDSIDIEIPIVANRDKGTNKFTVTIDADNATDELFESNNTITKEVIIYEDELRPVYPYNFSIVNKQGIKFFASTANAFSPNQSYRFEIDTTERFNLPQLVSVTTASKGGVIEFAPSITFRDSIVYYWRVAPVATNNVFNWNTSSFIYLPGSELGFNQSHYYQHLKSTANNMYLDTITRKWSYKERSHNLFMRNGVFPSAASQAVDFSVALDGDPSIIRSICGISELIIHVIDQNTFKPWANNPTGQPGLYGSDPICGDSRLYNFKFNILDTGSRRRLMNFLDFIPDGDFVIFKNASGVDPATNTYASDWQRDTSFLGSNNSIYHRLKAQGFTQIDSFNRPRAFIFLYKKNQPQKLAPQFVFSEGTTDKINLSVDVTTPDWVGTVLSPVFGPAKTWKKLMWIGTSDEVPNTDEIKIKLIGTKVNGVKDTLNVFDNSLTFSADISNVDANVYPYLQILLEARDKTNFTPYQLKSWQLTYTPKPEGAVAPNLSFSMKDTFDVGEPIDFKLAFKNISDVSFDSLKVNVTITDRNNVAHNIVLPRTRPLIAGDTVIIHFPLDSRQLQGANSLFLEVNPNDDQPELHHFNNFIYKNFYVVNDSLSPVLDVTFDNQHILNGDIVSAKPGIMIKLKDNAKFQLLDDTSLLSVQVIDPVGNVLAYPFNTDTLQFVPAQSSSSEGNEATVHFKPYFTEDGTYQLIVKGRDKSNNAAGLMEYRVNFQVINKPMISNMLNYPNPFTSSTAFVFTITGSEVPQNLRIQILTITGKVVREIKKEELGAIRIGRNITDFKWDGTDQYGQKLANGVYLYRVVTNLNGKSLDKYKSEGDRTEQFFNNGYGKMYLMR